MSSRIGLPRVLRGRLFAFAVLLIGLGTMPCARAAPHIPSNDDAG
jgi:hypothetical protein